MTDEQFYLALAEALGVRTAGEAAKVLRVARPTVERWLRGESLPHPAGRDSILRALRGDVPPEVKCP